MRVAIVHDYLNQMGGAERVVAALHRGWPDAPIHTTIADPARLSDDLRRATLRTTWMQHLPGWRAHFRRYLPLYPVAVAGMDLRGYDLVLSSSSAFAVGAPVPPGVPHLCYVHTPARFLWDFEGYVAREGLSAATVAALRPLIGALRAHDRRVAQRPTLLVANSANIAARIRRVWGREAVVVPPPVALERFRPRAGGAGRHFLVVSRLAHYKRLDLAVTACTAASLPLLVVGDGPARAALERLAGPTVRFAGRLDDAAVVAAYRDAIALVFPGEEDFGIAPLEANASGVPVVAYAAGGALETVRDGETGVLFEAQTSAALVAALHRVRDLPWDPSALRSHAEGFSEGRFLERIRALVARA